MRERYEEHIRNMKEFAARSYKIIKEFDDMDLPEHEREIVKGILYEQRREYLREKATELMDIIYAMVREE